MMAKKARDRWVAQGMMHEDEDGFFDEDEGHYWQGGMISESNLTEDELPYQQGLMAPRRRKKPVTEHYYAQGMMKDKEPKHKTNGYYLAQGMMDDSKEEPKKSEPYWCAGMMKDKSTEPVSTGWVAQGMAEIKPTKAGDDCGWGGNFRED